MADSQPPPYELGFCPVCGYEGWKGSIAGDDYDDCPCCEVDFCIFTCRSDDPAPLRADWLLRHGLTSGAFLQLTHNLRLVPDQPSTWPAVLYAAALGRLDDVRAAMEAGNGVDTPNERGETALMWAAGMGHIEIVDVLIASGANINQRSGADPCNAAVPAGSTAITWAARAGHAAIIQRILAAVASESPSDMHKLVNAGDAAGITPTMEAAVFPLIDCLALLMDQGADVQIRAQDGTSALSRAAETGSPQAVDILIRAGATVDAFLHDGDRPLTLALRRWEDDPIAAIAICHQLLNAGADPNIPGARNWSSPFEEAIQTMDEVLIERFLSCGAIPEAQIFNNPQTGKSWTAVPLAAAARLLDSPASRRILQRLLDLGVTVNAENGFAVTPLYSAMLNDNWHAARVLIEAGANPLVDTLGVTPLMYAAKYASPEWVDLALVPRVGKAAVAEARTACISPDQYAAANEVFLRNLGIASDDQKGASGP